GPRRPVHTPHDADADQDGGEEQDHDAGPGGDAGAVSGRVGHGDSFEGWSRVALTGRAPRLGALPTVCRGAGRPTGPVGVPGGAQDGPVEVSLPSPPSSVGSSPRDSRSHSSLPRVRTPRSEASAGGCTGRRRDRGAGSGRAARVALTAPPAPAVSSATPASTA